MRRLKLKKIIAHESGQETPKSFQSPPNSGISFTSIKQSKEQTRMSAGSMMLSIFWDNFVGYRQKRVRDTFKENIVERCAFLSRQCFQSYLCVVMTTIQTFA